jgi:PAS domain S-box-containing protein
LFYIQLVQNVGLLVALVAVHGQIIRYWKRSAFSSQVVSGFLFGCVALIGMMAPVHLTPGVIFDGRSIVLSVAGLFGGPVTAGIAAILSVAYRLWLGGPGALMGVSVIIESASLGVAFYYLRPVYPGLTRNLRLFAFGLLVHMGMLLLALLLPRDAMLKTLENITIPVLLIFPAATWLICLLFLDQENRMSSQRALEESERKYRDLYDNSPDMLFSIDVNTGKILECNQTLCDVSGYSRDEIIGRSIFELYHPDSHLEARKCFQRFTDEGEVHNAELRALKKNGTTMFVTLNATGIYNDKGSLVYSRSSWRDVTDRRLTEIALRESEERHRAIFDNAGIGIDLLDSGGRVVAVNQALSDMLGYTVEELERLTFSELTHPDDIETSRQMLEALVAGEKHSYRIEKRYLRKDGSILWGDLSVSAIRDDAGKHTGAVGVVADITQRKKVEESLRDSEAFLNSIIDQSPNSMWISDHQGTLLRCNKTLRDLFQLSDNEVVGHYNIFEDNIVEAQGLRPLIRSVFEQGSTVRFTINYDSAQLKNISPVHRTSIFLDVTVFPIRDHNGNITNAVIQHIDISESKRLESQLFHAQKMEAVGTLAGGIAHDFNNLLQIVLGYSEVMLLRKKEGEHDYVDLHQIYQAGKRGADLVTSLMTFSRKVEANFIPVDLNQEITQLQDLLSHTIPKIIKFDLRLIGDLEVINADPSQIGQVLMNLGVNARDAMPDGGTLTIETANVVLEKEYCRDHLEAIPGSYVLLTVSDTGQGMDKETLSHIFEPFFTTKGKGKGTGLGLATAYGIVKQHGGHITCYSELGMGTAFKIYFPAIEQAGDSETRTNDGPIRGGTETILLVDDDDEIRDLGATLLNSFGYVVIRAGNGKEALDIYQRERESISLVILDLIMPVMDGRKCLAEILRIDPHAKVIIASGYSEGGPANGVMAARAKGFVQKPYSMRQLLTTIRKALDKDLPRPVDDQDGR